MKTPEIAYNFSGLDASGYAVKGQSIYNKLNGNPAFTSPTPFLSILQTNVNNLTAAITAGGTTPTPVQTGAIHDAVKALKRVLKVIGNVVNWDANGNETTLLSSGFELKSYSPSGLKTFSVKQGSLSGTADADSPAYHNAAYAWFFSADPIGTWTQALITTISKATITSLIPGQKYWFKVVVTQGSKVVFTADPYMVHVV